MWCDGITSYYGFIAVFVCAVAPRNFEIYYKRLHAFSDSDRKDIGGDSLDPIWWKHYLWYFVHTRLVVGVIRTKRQEIFLWLEQIAPHVVPYAHTTKLLSDFLKEYRKI